MNKCIALLALVLLSSAAAAYDFKGLVVGGPDTYTPDQVEQVLFADGRRGKCGVGSPPTVQVCNGVTTVGGVVGSTNTVVTSGRVTRVAISFDSDNFEAVEQVVTGKFGAPSANEGSAVQNRMGAAFQNRTLLWKGPGGRFIRLEKYPSTLDRSQLYFGSAEDTALLQEITKPKADDI